MGRNPLISRESAIRTAVEIIDADGLDGLNLERIAKALGVRAPSLYYHFKDKAEILAEAARLVFSEVDIEQHSDDWQQYMVDVCLSFYETVLRHPNAVGLLLESMPLRVSEPTFALAAQAMTKAGVDVSLQRILMTGTENITWGAAMRKAMEMRRGTDDEVAARAEDRYPVLRDARRNSRWTDSELLEASVRAFINGVVRTADEPATNRRNTHRSRPTAAARTASRKSTPATRAR